MERLKFDYNRQLIKQTMITFSDLHCNKIPVSECVLIVVAGDLDSLFVHAADCRHCQDGAVCPAPLPSVAADDVRDDLCNHFYNFRSFS
jgi:hypothetical protein